MSPSSADSSPAPLLGHWQFQYQEQRTYLASGELAEVSRQAPPQHDCRALHITAQTLSYHYEYGAGGPPGRRGYTVARAYTRHGDTLLVVPAPGFEPQPTTIVRLTTTWLVLLVVPAPNLGFAYEWETAFSR